MINFLRISNNIKLGNYLHQDGTIDDIPSDNIIGVCVIPSNFLPDGLARFMSIQQLRSIWDRDRNINIDNVCKKGLPGKVLDEQGWGFLDGFYPTLVSPYLSDGSFNLDFLKDLKKGNAFQDYKGYENTDKYKKKYGDSEDLENAFSSCFKLSPLYRKSEWYLPSIGELALLFEKESLINLAIKASLSRVVLSSDDYWSSSEYGSEDAWKVNMTTGIVNFNCKDNRYHVRAFLAL